MSVLPALWRLTRPLCLILIAHGLSGSVWAASDSAKIIQSGLWPTDGKALSRPKVVALLNMDEVMPDCQQRIAMVKVTRVAYSASGITPEKMEVRWSGRSLKIDTNIGENPILTLEEIYAAHAFIQVGKRYLVHFQSCAEGTQRSLINLYATQQDLPRQWRKMHI